MTSLETRRGTFDWYSFVGGDILSSFRYDHFVIYGDRDVVHGGPLQPSSTCIDATCKPLIKPLSLLNMSICFTHFIRHLVGGGTSPSFSNAPVSTACCCLHSPVASYSCCISGGSAINADRSDGTVARRAVILADAVLLYARYRPSPREQTSVCVTGTTATREHSNQECVVPRTNRVGWAKQAFRQVSPRRYYSCCRFRACGILVAHGIAGYRWVAPRPGYAA